MKTGRKISVWGLSMNDNGYSLIELIIVMAIISILAVFSFNGIQYLDNGNSKKAVSEIDKSLNKVRLESMSKIDKKYALVLSKEVDGYYIYVLNNTTGATINSISDGTIIGSKKKIGNETSIITYTLYNSPTEHVLDVTNPLIIRYKGNNGTFETDYSNITITIGNKVSTLNLVKKTGKHFQG